jgi:3'-phosphoadenosine 5'-phosphosulfate sulfotransferase (PAPS reductase)/FAD synthetase
MVPVLHVISLSSGKDSQALLDIALERCPRESVRVIFCDTDNEDEAVYAHLDYLEKAYGIRIDRLKADFTDEILAKREFVARDVRTKRQYIRVPRLDADGNVIFRRDKAGHLELRMVWRRGVMDLEGVPSTDKRKGRKVRWSNKAKRRALEVLHPTGNAFLDLCLWKGRFPSRKAQFCTEELKRNMAVSYQLELMAAGYNVISWQGVRRDESDNRASAKLFERIGRGIYAFRPLVDWTAAQVFDRIRQSGLKPNPLYLQGMGRVGCMPCINCNKVELREISARKPKHLFRIADWEVLVSKASKRGGSTFMADAHDAADRRVVFADLHIWSRVEWAKTTRGGQQYDLLIDADEPSACSSSYGLCEQADSDLIPEAA